MTLQELKYLVALADHGHFGRAAEACFITQSTLSTQLKKLEGFLGVTLFDRSLKRVTPTPIGREILQAARNGHIDLVTAPLLGAEGVNAFVCGTKSTFRGAHEATAYAQAVSALRSALLV